MKFEELGIGLNTYNSEKYIRTLMDSITSQKYKNFKLYVLDNQSTDKTKKIIYSYKSKINIKFVTDTTKRDIPSSQKKLINTYLLNHKYSMIINDDDKYNSNYISKLIKHLNLGQHDMVYSNFNFFNEQQTIKAKNKPIYNSNKFINVINFYIYRNVVPICFGIYKSKAIVDAIKFFNPDRISKTNYDNQFILHFLANYRIGYIKEKLFNYFIKNRIEINKGKKKNIYRLDKSLYLIFLIQFIFAKNFFLIIYNNSYFNFLQKLFIFFIIPIIYFQKCLSYISKYLLRKFLH